MMKRLIAIAAMAAGLACAAPARATCTPTTVATPGADCGPQIGGATVVLDLAGQALPGDSGPNPYITDSGTFTTGATQTSTQLTLAFRNDPNYQVWEVAGVSLSTGGGSNLLTNGDFTHAASTYLGPFGGQLLPTQWNYAYQGETSSANPGISSPGQLAGCPPLNGTTQQVTCWRDGATNGYDDLSQTLYNLAPNTTYSVSLLYTASNGAGTAARTGPNAADIVVYEAPAAPAGVPEPAALSLLGAGLALMARRRRA